MCYALKYGIWNVAKIEAENVNALVRTGYGPLTAMVLSSRGIGDEKQARQYLGCGDFLRLLGRKFTNSFQLHHV